MDCRNIPLSRSLSVLYERTGAHLRERERSVFMKGVVCRVRFWREECGNCERD